jgi:hypothetical protein
MDELAKLKNDLMTTIDRLPQTSNGKWIQRTLETIVRLSETDIDRLDWKILSASVGDMERAFQVFYPYRHTRKVAIFGSARTSEQAPEYQLAEEFARAITQQGFMAITGGGGGIMAAANAGAGFEQSFGLNIQLPYEQGANKYISGDPKSIEFKYFFTRKLFFLRESDADIMSDWALWPRSTSLDRSTWRELLARLGSLSASAPSSYWLNWTRRSESIYNY